MPPYWIVVRRVGRGASLPAHLAVGRSFLVADQIDDLISFVGVLHHVLPEHAAQELVADRAGSPVVEHTSVAAVGLRVEISLAVALVGPMLSIREPALLCLFGLHRSPL